MIRVDKNLIELLLAKIIDNCLKHEDGSRAAEDGERLAGEETVGDAHNEARHQGLHAGHAVASRVPQEAPESDDRGETSKVDEKVGCDALKGHCVLEI